MTDASNVGHEPMNGWERNAVMFEFFQAVAEEDDTRAQHIATSMPPGEPYPFLVTVTHQALKWLARLLGDDWLDQLRVQAMEARIVAEEHQDEEQEP